MQRDVGAAPPRAGGYPNPNPTPTLYQVAPCGPAELLGRMEKSLLPLELCELGTLGWSLIELGQVELAAGLTLALALTLTLALALTRTLTLTRSSSPPA